MADIQKIRAKSVINNEFWILQKNNIKIGEIKAKSPHDIEVVIHGNKAHTFESVEEMVRSGLFEFVELPKIDNEPTMTVHGYPADTIAYNAVWNVQYGLPLYNQTEDSKSWFAAGYYKVRINDTWIVQYCPKLITLQRNEYNGPYEQDPGLNNFNKFFE